MVKRRGDEINELKEKNKVLESKVTDQLSELDRLEIASSENQLNLMKYKRTIIKLNQIAKVKNPKVKFESNPESEEKEEKNPDKKENR